MSLLYNLNNNSLNNSSSIIMDIDTDNNIDTKITDNVINESTDDELLTSIPPKLHRTANIFKWHEAAVKLVMLENSETFQNIKNTTIMLPIVCCHNYCFECIYKYPMNIMDYVIVVDVFYTSSDIILIGVKNNEYYKVIVHKNDFGNPILYKINLSDYLDS